MLKKVLFITYDGLTDPLGSSQIVPYINIISSNVSQTYVLSFEKNFPFSISRKNFIGINSVSLLEDIKWIPIRFTSGLGLFGKIFDLLKMYSITLFLLISKGVNIIHARGHPTAVTAVIMKIFFRFRKLHFIFDFRGLWVDERVDKGGWNTERNFHKFQFNLFKSIERYLLKKADAIVVLTRAMKLELLNRGFKDKFIEVIPCCCNYELFNIDPFKRKTIRKQLKLNHDDLILGYIGSVGSMYRFEDLFNSFIKLQALKKNVYLLFLTNDLHAAQIISSSYLPEKLIKDHVIIKKVSYSEMPDYMSAIDISIFFLKNSYARLGTSPTKFAESLASGVPVICNNGIGDLDDHVTNNNFGKLIFSEESKKSGSENFIDAIDFVLTLDRAKLREQSKHIYGLEVAKFRYTNVYKFLKTK